MSQANEQTMRRLVEEVINDKCLAVIDEIVHPEYVYRAPGQELHGRPALAKLLSTYHEAFPDLHVAIDELLCSDSKAVLLFTLSGTHQNELLGIPASGNKVTVNGMTCSRIDNGQIIEEWELLDQLTLLQQLDAVSI